jgi:histone demethylase JARID1
MRVCILLGADMNTKKKFATKLQQLDRLQEGISFGDGGEYNPGEYQRMASKCTKDYKAKNYPNHDVTVSQQGDDQSKMMFSAENLEKDYWSIVETRSRSISVEYGNDVNTDEFGSGFPLSERGRSLVGTTKGNKVSLPEPKFGTEDYYKETWWNTNNMPSAPGSVLRHVKVAINGINVPWMYYGSLFTTFCWHNEDNYLYSVNYHHEGAPKQVSSPCLRRVCLLKFESKLSRFFKHSGMVYREQKKIQMDWRKFLRTISP